MSAKIKPPTFDPRRHGVIGKTLEVKDILASFQVCVLQVDRWERTIAIEVEVTKLDRTSDSAPSAYDFKLFYKDGREVDDSSGNNKEITLESQLERLEKKSVKSVRGWIEFLIERDTFKISNASLRVEDFALAYVPEEDDPYTHAWFFLIEASHPWNQAPATAAPTDDDPIAAQLLASRTLYDVAPRLIADRRPTIALLEEPADDASLPVGVSKLGGLPDLPDDLAWPVLDLKSHSLPLTFVGQLNFAEIKPHDRSGLLPDRGLLYVFYLSYFLLPEHRLPAGLKDSGDGAIRALYVADPGQARKGSRPAPEGLLGERSTETKRLGFAARYHYPVELRPYKLKDSQKEEYQEEIDWEGYHGGNNCLLGYWYNTPAVELPASDPNVFVLAFQKTWSFGLDSGKNGELKVLQSKEDLRAGRWDRLLAQEG